MRVHNTTPEAIQAFIVSSIGDLVKETKIDALGDSWFSVTIVSSCSFYTLTKVCRAFPLVIAVALLPSIGFRRPLSIANL